MRVNDAADRDRDSDIDTEDHDKEEMGISASASLLLKLKVDKIVLENEEERYMLVVSSSDSSSSDNSLGPKETETVMETNKENVEGSLTLRVERRYDVYSLKPQLVDAADDGAGGVGATPSTPSPDALKSTSTPTPQKDAKVGLKATEATSELEAKTKTNGTSHSSHVDNGGGSHALPSPTSANTSPRQERAVGVGKRSSLAALMDDLDDDVNLDTVNTKELKDSDVHQHQHSSGMPTPPLTTAEVGGPSESSPVAPPPPSSSSPRPYSTTRSVSNFNSKPPNVQYEKEPELELEPPVLAELVHRGLGAERLRFVASGVSIVASSAECNNGAGSGNEKPTFVRVERWRRAAPREVEALSASAST